MRVQTFLEEREVGYEVLRHEPAYDAQRLAASIHESGERVAKTVLLRTHADYVVAVVPATHSLSSRLVRDVLGEAAEIADESEVTAIVSDCEVGVLPPFGALYGLRTLMDPSLILEDEIVFEGNTHAECVRMKTHDYLLVEQPEVVPLSFPSGAAPDEASRWSASR